MWIICHEFHMMPAQIMDMDLEDYTFLLYGLEWWRTKEQEAIDHARH